MLAYIPVTCSPHKALNSSRGVFGCNDLKYCTEAEIKSELKDQAVTDIKRIKAKQNGQLVITVNSNRASCGVGSSCEYTHLTYS